MTTTETALEAIERAGREYRLKYYGTLDVDMFGRKLLNSDEMIQQRQIKNMPPSKRAALAHEQIEGAQWRFV